MTEKRELFIELSIVALISYWLFFLQTNVNPVLGNIYTNLTLGSIGVVLVDAFFGQKTIKLFNKKVSWVQAFAFGVGGYVAVLLSTQLTSALSGVIPLTEILNLLGSSAPVFSNSPIINFITFGQIIAYIESYALFIAGFDLMGSLFKVEISKRNLFNPKLQMIIIGISILFLMLHVTAKGIDNESTLFLVFLMAYISLTITAWTQDGRACLILHLGANTVAASSLFIKTATVILPLGSG